MRFGQLPFDLAHLLAGAMLLCSFVLLYQRRGSSVITVFAVQGGCLALAAAWQGWVQDAPGLFVTAAIALLAKAIAIPVALRRLVRRLALPRGVEVAMGIGPSLIAGIALVGLAVLVVLPVTASGGAGVLTREDLAIALSIILLGMLMMITRRNLISQAVGLLSLENGLILAAIGVQGMPLVVELSIAALVLAVAMVAGFFAHGMRERFESLDVHALEPHRGERL